MAKFRQGNLVLGNTNKIIFGTDEIRKSGGWIISDLPIAAPDSTSSSTLATKGYVDSVVGGGLFTEDADGNIVGGSGAGANLTTGIENFMAGVNAGNAITSNNQCVIIGTEAASSGSPTVNGAIIIGYRAGLSGGGGVIIGTNSGSVMTSQGNTVIGINAAQDVTTGNRNVYIGENSGQRNQGEYNTCIGFDSGQGTSTHDSDYNTLIGYAAGFNIDGGDNNTAVGARACYNITSGQHNTAIGVLALYGNSTGTYNTALGSYAMGFSSGFPTRNVAVGYESGIDLQGFDNTFTGYRSGYNVTGATGNVAHGSNALYYNQTGGFNVAIGYEAIYGVSGQSPAFNVGIGYRAGYSMNGIAQFNTFVGHQAGRYNVSGVENVGVGSFALLQNVTGLYNTALGYAAGRGVSGVSIANCVFIGYQAGRNNEATLNTYVGSYAGYGVFGSSTGGENVFVGYRAGELITSGTRNVAIGRDALGDANPGDENTVIGYLAGPDITGANNVIYGSQAGSNITSGSNNIVIGYNIDPLSATGSNQFALGTSTYPFLRGDMSNYQLAIYGANGYLNFNTTLGSGGYGFRDNAGTMEFKNSGGSWAAFGAGGGGLFTEDGNSNIYGGTGSGTSITTGTYNFLAGVNAGAATTEADENVLIGRNAGLSITTHEGNVAVGSHALSESQTIDTVAIGYSAARYGDHFSAVAIGKNALQGVSGTSNTLHCVAIGENALQDITTGQFDTGVGDRALNSITSGDYNTAVGGYSLRYNETGDFNTVVGSSAGGSTASSNITDNTFIGYRSGTNLGNNQVGNVAVGSRSLELLNVGNKNVGIGLDVCDNLNQGNYNVCIGAEIGMAAGSEIYSNNVIIGYQAGYSVTTSNNTLIGYQAGYSLATGSDNVLIGYQAGYNIDSTSSDVLIIANNSSEALIEGDFANRTLHINGTFTAESSNLNNIFSNYTIDLTDADTTIIVDSTNNTTITVPTDAAASLPDGFTCAVLRRNTGEVTVTGDTGVTVGSPDGADTLRVQWSTATLLKIDTDVWALSGDIQ